MSTFCFSVIPCHFSRRDCIESGKMNQMVTFNRNHNNSPKHSLLLFIPKSKTKVKKITRKKIFRVIKVWLELINRHCHVEKNCLNATECRRYCPFLMKYAIYYCYSVWINLLQSACKQALFHTHLHAMDCCEIYN